MAMSTSTFATTDDFSGFLPEQAAPIFENDQALAGQPRQKIEMGPTGVSIPFWDGDVRHWVDEAGKPLAKGGFDQFCLRRRSPHLRMSSEVVEPTRSTTSTSCARRWARLRRRLRCSRARHQHPFGAYLDQTTKAVALDDPNAYGAPATRCPARQRHARSSPAVCSTTSPSRSSTPRSTTTAARLHRADLHRDQLPHPPDVSGPSDHHRGGCQGSGGRCSRQLLR